MNERPANVAIRKLNLAGEEVFAYSGEVVARTPNSVVVEAFFTRYDRLDLGYTVFERGDRFVEHFYSDRWYNIFEVYSGDDGRLKGWYSNVTRPAVIEAASISAVDLALDLFVHPDGRVLVLDEEEFAALPIEDAERQQALAAVEELKMLVEARAEMFGVVEPAHPPFL